MAAGKDRKSFGMEGIRMTPQGLLTVIGATAIGFTIAIGSAVGLTSSSATTTHVTTTEQAPSMAYATPGMNLAQLLDTGGAQRAASSDRDCVIAL
jgi:hypothetical protein